ncbi:MAG: hypothetical protein H6625_14140 [Bdellovibrionaceae bacterium]|nr:hypothetical protein [Pseudobdellovibrionaceae bacterium]
MSYFLNTRNSKSSDIYTLLKHAKENGYYPTNNNTFDGVPKDANMFLRFENDELFKTFINLECIGFGRLKKYKNGERRNFNWNCKTRDLALCYYGEIPLIKIEKNYDFINLNQFLKRQDIMKSASDLVKKLCGDDQNIDLYKKIIDTIISSKEWEKLY